MFHQYCGGRYSPSLLLNLPLMYSLSPLSSFLSSSCLSLKEGTSLYFSSLVSQHRQILYPLTASIIQQQRVQIKWLMTLIKSSSLALSRTFCTKPKSCMIYFGKGLLFEEYLQVCIWCSHSLPIIKRLLALWFGSFSLSYLKDKHTYIAFLTC